MIARDRVAGPREAFFPLLAQVSSLLRLDAFPRLRYIRDISPQSHEMRVSPPAGVVLDFWESVLCRCEERTVQLEDYHGMNITVRSFQVRTQYLVESLISVSGQLYVRWAAFYPHMPSPSLHHTHFSHCTARRAIIYPFFSRHVHSFFEFYTGSASPPAALLPY